jgi:hypothetical protein
MKNLKAGFVGAGLITLAILFLLQHQAQEKLRVENAVLAQQLTGLETDNESLSNRLAAAGDARSFSDKEHNELLKLRGEVGLLRRQTNEFGKVREENQQLQDGRAVVQISTQPQDAFPQDISKDSLKFAGYATPVAALQSAYWAASKGDLKAFFASVTPETNLQIIGKLRNEGDVNDSTWLRQQIVSAFGSVDNLHISNEKMTSENEAFLNYDGERKGQGALMVKIGGEWKFSLQTNQ